MPRRHAQQHRLARHRARSWWQWHDTLGFQRRFAQRRLRRGALPREIGRVAAPAQRIGAAVCGFGGGGAVAPARRLPNEGGRVEALRVEGAGRSYWRRLRRGALPREIGRVVARMAACQRCGSLRCWGRPLSRARERFAVAGVSRAGPVKRQRRGPVPPFAGLVGARRCRRRGELPSEIGRVAAPALRVTAALG